MRVKMSLMGLYQFDNTLFDNFNLPVDINRNGVVLTEEERSELRQNIIDYLLMENGEFSVLYTDPVFMKYAIGVWSKTFAYNIKKMYESYYFQYNPIWNVDGTVTNTRTPNITRTRKNTGTLTNGNEGALSVADTGTTRSEHGGNIGTERKISADNQQTYSPDSLVTETDGTNVEDTRNLQSITTDTRKTTTVDDRTETNSEAGSEKTEEIRKGNVGVTSTQSMIVEERELLKENFVEYVSNLFKTKLLVCVYT